MKILQTLFQVLVVMWHAISVAAALVIVFYLSTAPYQVSGDTPFGIETQSGFVAAFLVVSVIAYVLMFLVYFKFINAFPWIVVMAISLMTIATALAFSFIYIVVPPYSMGLIELGASYLIGIVAIGVIGTLFNRNKTITKKHGTK